MQPGESRINLTNNSADSGHGSTSDGHDHGHLHHEDMDPATDMDPASVVFKDEVTPNFVPPEKISDLAFKDKTASILP